MLTKFEQFHLFAKKIGVEALVTINLLSSSLQERLFETNNTSGSVSTIGESLPELEPIFPVKTSSQLLNASQQHFPEMFSSNQSRKQKYIHKEQDKLHNVTEDLA